MRPLWFTRGLRGLYRWWWDPSAVVRARAIAAGVAGAAAASVGLASAGGGSAGLRIALAAASIASAVALFVISFREQRLPYAYVDAHRRKIEENPAFLFQRVAELGGVVGRDDVCKLILSDLEVSAARRPQLVVGELGTGKTALLARLAQHAARRGLVPVVVGLEDEATGLDLLAQARRAFARAMADRLAESEADRIWNQLLNADRTMVLVDNVDVALHRGPGAVTEVRVSIEEAMLKGQRLVLAGRPRGALEYLDAVLRRLEPLPDHVVADYIARRHAADDQRAQWMTAALRIGGLPTLMSIAAELAGVWRLSAAAGGPDLRGVTGRIARVRLLEAWLGALTSGAIVWSVPLAAEQRADALAGVGSLAATATSRGSRRIAFSQHESADARFGLREAWDGDVPLAATRGARLGLLDIVRGGVRFRDSTMQAYLAGRFVASMSAVRQASYWEATLTSPTRELMAALSLLPEAREGVISVAIDALIAASRSVGSDWPVALLAVASELDDEADSSRMDGVHAALIDVWPDTGSGERARWRKLRVVERLSERARVAVAEDRARGPAASAASAAYDTLRDIARSEPAYEVRIAAARELGGGGSLAFDRVTPWLAGPDRAAQSAAHVDRDSARLLAVEALLVPLFASSVDDPSAGARDLLRGWTDWARADMPLPLQAAFAEGLRLAANRLAAPRRDSGAAAARPELLHRATELYQSSEFWFARLVLCHAICLFVIQLEDPRREFGARIQRAPDRTAEHPFVTQTIELCMRALETGIPARYLWTDETLAASKPGPGFATVAPGIRRQWIPPEAGWQSLDRRAQQLLGDVILYLNLADGGGSRRASLTPFAGTDLPPCLAGARRTIDAHRGLAQSWEAGERCVEGCDFDLCPLPPKAAGLARGELSEAFCLLQRRLLGPSPASRPPWTDASRHDLRDFWEEMASRARL